MPVTAAQALSSRRVVQISSRFSPVFLFELGWRGLICLRVGLGFDRCVCGIQNIRPYR
jgi:hypothetical protein